MSVNKLQVQIPVIIIITVFSLVSYAQESTPDAPVVVTEEAPEVVTEETENAPVAATEKTENAPEVATHETEDAPVVAMEDAPEVVTEEIESTPVVAVEEAPEIVVEEPVEATKEPTQRETVVIERVETVEEELPAPPLLLDESSLSAIRLEPEVESDNIFYLAYEYVIKDRLALGARITTFTLEDAERDSRENSFLGSITKLDAEQDNTPRVFINYKFFRFLGVGVTWNQLRAETITHVREDGLPGDMHTDGTIDLQGFLYYVTVRLPNRTRFTPFAEYGVAQYDASFDHDPLWRSSGNNRLMVLENTDSSYYAVGLDVQIYEGLQLNLYYRKMDVDVDAKYYLNDDQMAGDPREESTFPMGHYAYGIGLKYAF